MTRDQDITRWPHQERALDGAREQFRNGIRRVCVVAPTGAGKSLCQRDMVRGAIDRGMRPLLMVHRRLLLEQVVNQFKEQGIDYGVIAAGWKPDPMAPVQIAMLQTLSSRGGSGAEWFFPDVDLVVWDEMHAQKSGQAKEINQHYHALGRWQCGFTATPVDIGGVADALSVAANYSDMLECGAHMPLVCYGPDRPDLAKIKPMSAGEYSENQCEKVIKVDTVFGRVYDHWKKYNPEAFPAINFTSGTKASQFWVALFQRSGVPTGSIDAKRITWTEWTKVDGVKKLVLKEFENGNSHEAFKARKELFWRLEYGNLKIIHNRFILREAIDLPFVYQAIITTPMGSVSTYLQSVGRVMRHCDAYDHKLIQDHGGVIESLGFPNEDRDWQLGDTNTSIKQKIIKERQEKQGDDAEPICCPKCCAFRTHGAQCPTCGHMHKRSARIVRQLDGTLKKKLGRTTPHKKRKTAEQIFRSQLYGSYAAGASVNVALHLARKKCQQQGIPWTMDFKSITLPDNTNVKVRTAFPWAKPRHLRK